MEAESSSATHVGVPDSGMGSGVLSLDIDGISTTTVGPAPDDTKHFAVLAEHVEVFTKRTARQAESLWAEAKAPPWDEAVASLWWRWTGHLAWLETRRRQDMREGCAMERGLVAEDCARVHGAAHRTRQTAPQQGRRILGKRRWDEPL